MKPLWYAAVFTTLFAAGASAAFGAGLEVWLGAVAPLAVVFGSSIIMARASRQRPERLTSIMVAAFAGKLVFFGLYVSFLVGVVHVRPIPFAASFAVSFIALYAAQAAYLQQLFAERMRAA